MNLSEILMDRHVTIPYTRVIVKDPGKHYPAYKVMAEFLGYPDAVSNRSFDLQKYDIQGQKGIVLNSHQHLNWPNHNDHICCVFLEDLNRKILIGADGLDIDQQGDG